MLARGLMAASGLVVLVFGTIHLFWTFRGKNFWPRDEKLKPVLEAATMQLTRDTSFWNAWIGFNASHSFGAMLYGLVFGYLGACAPEFFFHSVFLQITGAVFLGALLIVARRYWFSKPFGGVLVSSICYAAAIVAFHLLGNRI